MKNIINIIKNSISNNNGKVPANVVRGFSVGIFAAIILYGVYTSYNNSPAYNPARRGIFTGEQNLSANSLEGFNLNLEGSNAAQNNAAYGSGVISTGDGFERAGSVRNRFSKEQADFEAARAYMSAQQIAAQQANQANPMLKSKDGVRNTFNAVSSGVNGAEGEQAGKSAKGNRTSGQRNNAQTGQTQLNRLAGGNSAGSSYGGAGGSSINGGSSVNGGNLYARANDSATKTLPTNNVEQGQAKADTFRNGRGGAIGGVNVSRGGSATEGGTKGGRGGNAKDQLMSANMYSRNAGKSLQTPGGKNLETAAQNADNAFDGGGLIAGSTIDGDNVVAPDSVGLNNFTGGLDLNLDKIQTDWETDAEKKKRLFNNILLHMGFAAVATALAVVAIINILRTKAWYTYAIAGAITLSALYAIWFADYDGDGLRIIETLDTYDSLRHADGQNSVQGWFYLGMTTIFCGALAWAWIKGLRGGATEEEILEEGAEDTAEGAGTGGVVNKTGEWLKDYATNEAINQAKNAASKEIGKND